MSNLYDVNNNNNTNKQRIQHKQSKHKVKVRITTSGAGEDEDVLPKFLPFEGKYVSVGVVWRHNAPQEATKATVFSSRPRTMQEAVIPLVVPLKAATEPLQTRLGQSPQLNWRLPTPPRSFTTMEYDFTVTSSV